MSRRVSIRVATDCSGIEAPIQALKQLKIKHKSNYCLFFLNLNFFQIFECRAKSKRKIISSLKLNKRTTKN